MTQVADQQVIDPVEDFLRLTVLANPYIPIIPTNKQAQFLVRQEDEVLFGGAARGAKSFALLAAALQFVTVPKYNALILRRSFPDLTQPNALIPISFEWLSKTDAKWSDRLHRWSFPSGATLTFGHMNSENDKYQFQGASYNFVGYDELTQFTPTMYLYLFSRISRGSDVQIPGRMRAASNPGGPGHDFVKERFVSHPPNIPFKVYDENDSKKYSTRLFIPSRISDNPYVDRQDYQKMLSHLDPVTRAQLEHGDWDILDQGNLFKREWFKIVDSPPDDIVTTVRAWDLAATPVTASNPDPDWTAGCKMSRTKRKTIYIHDIRRIRGGPAQVERLLADTAAEDGKQVSIRIEKEPGASGKTLIYNYAKLLMAYDVREISTSAGRKGEGKIGRAKPFSAACERGDVEVQRADWNNGWLNHMVAFPPPGGKGHDDDVDAAAHAFNALASEIEFVDPTQFDISVYSV